MKAHIGVDLDSGRMHTVVGIAARVADLTQAHELLQGQETAVLGDAGYSAVAKRPENLDTPVTWHVALRPGVHRALLDDDLGRLQERIERAKAGLRAKVEHPFHVSRTYSSTSRRATGAAKDYSAAVYPVWLGQLGAGRLALAGT